MSLHRIAPLVAGVLLALSGAAHAATKTTTFGVSATVATNCLVSATNLAFGSYTGVAALTNTSTIGVRCTSGSAYSLRLNAGNGTITQRLLSDGGTNTLQYNLFTDAAWTQVWGDGTTGSVVSGSGNGLSASKEISHTVYGQLPNSVSNQDAPVGSYSDTITVTIEY